MSRGPYVPLDRSCTKHQNTSNIPLQLRQPSLGRLGLNQLSQLHTYNLPRRALRHRGNVPNPAPELLMARNLTSHPRVNLSGRVLARLHARCEHHIRARHFGGTRLVLHADDGGVGDFRMRRQHALQLGGRDLERVVFDQLLAAVRDEHVPLGVLVADIAGLEEPVGGKGLARLGRVVEVAFEDVGAFDPELADFAVRDLLVVRRYEFGG